MNVRLKPEDMERVREKVASGAYRDEAEVMSDALDALAQRDAALDAALEEGMADIRAGRVVTVRSKDEMDALFEKLCG
jgi:putative addiction module CopG family antidote